MTTNQIVPKEFVTSKDIQDLEQDLDQYAAKNKSTGYLASKIGNVSVVSKIGYRYLFDLRNFKIDDSKTVGAGKNEIGGDVYNKEKRYIDSVYYYYNDLVIIFGPSEAETKITETETTETETKNPDDLTKDEFFQQLKLNGEWLNRMKTTTFRKMEKKLGIYIEELTTNYPKVVHILLLQYSNLNVAEYEKIPGMNTNNKPFIHNGIYSIPGFYKWRGALFLTNETLKPVIFNPKNTLKGRIVSRVTSVGIALDIPKYSIDDSFFEPKSNIGSTSSVATAEGGKSKGNWKSKGNRKKSRRSKSRKSRRKLTNKRNS
jgi:hypothetical protein